MVLGNQKQLQLSHNTVGHIVDNFLQTGSAKPEIGGNRSRTARTEDVIIYTEFCKVNN